MDVDAVPGLFIGFLGTEAVPRLFDVHRRKSFFTQVVTHGGERRLQRLFVKIGRLLDLLDGRAVRPRYAPQIKSVFLEHTLAFPGKQINDL